VFKDETCFEQIILFFFLLSFLKGIMNLNCFLVCTLWTNLNLGIMCVGAVLTRIIMLQHVQCAIFCFFPLFPTCSLQVPNGFPTCTLHVLTRFPTCSLQVPNGFLSGSQHVPFKFPLGSYWVPIGFPTCSLQVPIGFLMGSQHVPFKFPLGS